MMISVAIVGILASIAIPNFVVYQLRVKTSEARTLVGSIITSQTSFAAEYESYANITAGVPVATPSNDKRLWQSTPCPATCTRSDAQNCISFDCIGFEPPNRVYFQYFSPGTQAIGATPPEFAVGAVGDLDGDNRRSSFCYQSSNNGTGFGVITVPETACLSGIQSATLHNCNPANF